MIGNYRSLVICSPVLLIENNLFQLMSLTIAGFEVPRGSRLGPLLYLIYISDLHCAIKYCKVHHFADDINLMIFQTFVKTINKNMV